MANQPVQFIVETQLLLTPFLKGRERTHLLYKVCRAETPEALRNDFRAIAFPETRSFDQVENDALVSMKLSVANSSDVNRQNEEHGGATLLWEAAERGHEEAVHEILRHPDIDPNKVQRFTQTTPLHIAADRGHKAVVKALLRHPKIDINLGKVDTGASPLLAGAEQGREEIVHALLKNQADVNQASVEGVTPLCAACDRGREHCAELLLATDGIKIYQTTFLSLAASHGYVKMVEIFVAHFRRDRPSSCPGFPSQHHLDSDLQYRDAVLVWAREAARSAAPNSTQDDDATLVATSRFTLNKSQLTGHIHPALSKEKPSQPRPPQPTVALEEPHPFSVRKSSV
jgi:hypothetical protein